MPKMRKLLSAPGLFQLVFDNFKKIQPIMKNSKRMRAHAIPLVDCLMSGLAVFSLKYSSLLQFDQSKHTDKTLAYNLKKLFHVNHAPCDTQMRTRLDEVAPESIRQSFKSIFAAVQRGKALDSYQDINGTYLLSMDGTGFFSSKQLHCKNCCEKHHRDGSITYYHHMLCGAIVHPKLKTVIPLAPEAILKQDGDKKNDCERNAAKRFLTDTRREHPHLPITVVEDALFANGPHLKQLKALNMNYIISVKPADHNYLFDAVEQAKCLFYEIVDANEIKHKFKFVNGVSLNDANDDFLVNFIEYWEVRPNGKTRHFTWVTDHAVSEENVYKLMRGGRARWKIENETFNTLKNQGYHFEHNYGHGYQHLSTVFAMLMILAFLIDQVQELSCELFQSAHSELERKKYLWERIRSIFFNFWVNSWEDLFNHIIFRRLIEPLSIPLPKMDTS